MILHIPHSSTDIPDRFLGQFLLNQDDLGAEVFRMTDAFTDDLFSLPEVPRVQFPYSRLLIDVERFRENSEEPMATVGMGKFYTRTAHGQPLRRELTANEEQELLRLYDAHHASLERLVEMELAREGAALIVDCHSFPSTPLPCDQSQTRPRPPFCIGTDAFHTGEHLVRTAVSALGKSGYQVGIDSPYAGTIVPTRHFLQDSRVSSIMIEVNRSLYMDEASGNKLPSFASIQATLSILLADLEQAYSSRLKPEYFDAVFCGVVPGAGWPERFAIITACNPDGETVDDATNATTTRRLFERLAACGYDPWEVIGGSADARHQEAGFGVVCSLEAGIRLGREFRQDAIFWVEGDALSIINCANSQLKPLGSWQDRWLG